MPKNFLTTDRSIISPTFVQGTNPAAGAIFERYPNANEIWHVWSVTFLFVTDATATNRQMRIGQTSGFAPTQLTIGPQNQGASASVTYHASIGASVNTVLTTPQTWQMPLNSNIWMTSDWGLQITPINIQPGDQLSNIVIHYNRYSVR